MINVQSENKQKELNMKVCSACKIEKEITEFYKHKLGKEGLHANCKSCMKDYRVATKERIALSYKGYRDRNKDRINASNRQYYQSLKGRYGSYKNNAKKRGISFDLTIEQFESFWQRNCTYCGEEIGSIGIDRIDSSKGYQLENCVPCCTICNVVKMEHDLSFLNEHMLRMLRHQGII